MIWLSQHASSVVLAAGTFDSEIKVRWTAEVDIGLMSKIFAAPKRHETLALGEQEKDLARVCAEMVASKLIELGGFSEPLQSKEDLQDLTFPDNIILSNIKEALKKSTVVEASKKQKEVNKKKEDEKEALLQPKVATLNGLGNVTSSHEVYHQPAAKVETLEWGVFVTKQQEHAPLKQARVLFINAVRSLQQSTSEMPFALLLTKGKVSLQATRAVSPGELMIPLSLEKDASLHHDQEPNLQRHPNAVGGVVTWPVTEKEKDSGVEGDSHKIGFLVQPEVRLPCRNNDNKFTWKPTDAVHPFWTIKRQDKEFEQWNVELVEVQVNTLVACDFKGQVGKKAPIADTFQVTVPCIVNSKAIVAGEEVVLKHAIKAQAKAELKPKAGRTWVEETQIKERKRLRGQ